MHYYLGKIKPGNGGFENVFAVVRGKKKNDQNLH
jgi:hypothetical protein